MLLAGGSFLLSLAFFVTEEAILKEPPLQTQNSIYTIIIELLLSVSSG